MMTRTLVLVLLLLWLAFTLFPVYWLAVTALKPPPAVFNGPTYIPWVDFEPNLTAFREIFGGARGDVVRPLVNSSLIGLSAALIATALGTMAAYALVRFPFRVRLLAGVLFAVSGIGAFLALRLLGWGEGVTMGLAFLFALAVAVLANGLRLPGKVLGNDDVAFWFVSQRMFPPIVSAFALYLLYARLGREGLVLLDTYLGLTLCYVAFVLPIVVWLMRDFLQSLPVAVEEAALVDDVPRWRIFLGIVLPMARPGLVATFLIALSFVWNEFLFALILTSSEWQTMPINISGQASVRGTEWWAISAAALVAITPMVVIAAFLSRMMRSGLLLGAIR